MINFEDIVDFLSAKGVKSLHIEMHEKNLLATPLVKLESTIERVSACSCAGKHDAPLNDAQLDELRNMKAIFIPSPNDCRGKHDVPIHRGEPGGRESVRVEPATPPPVVYIGPSPEELAKTYEQLATPPIQPRVVPLVVVDESKPGTPPAVKEPVKAAVAEPAKPAPAPVAAASKPPYEAFCDLISSDDGNVKAEERMDLLGRMGLDDLLRVNNDFQLGLDTDKPVEDVRADIIECFK